MYYTSRINKEKLSMETKSIWNGYFVLPFHHCSCLDIRGVLEGAVQNKINHVKIVEVTWWAVSLCRYVGIE